MVTNRRFISLASVFIVCLSVISTYGNAASSYDEKAFTQAASTNPADSNNLPAGPGFPINMGGGGNSNGGGGWLRIWTPFGWITIGGGGDSHGGGGGGGFQPFVPPLTPLKPNPPQPFVPPPTPTKPNNPPHPPNPVTPSPCNPVMPHPPKPVTPNPSNPTPQHPPVTPIPSNPTPQHPSNPNIPPWLAPYIGSDGRLHLPDQPPRPIPKWLAPYIRKQPSPPSPSNPPPHPSNPNIPPWLAPYIGSDGRLHLPDQPSRPVPKWLAPYIGKPPQRSTPAHLAGNSMGTRSEASAVETSKTSLQERHQQYYQCWLPLEKTDKCVNEILTAFSSRNFEVLGSACCSAIEKMDKDCHARTVGSFHDHLFAASVHRHCSAN